MPPVGLLPLTDVAQLVSFPLGEVELSSPKVAHTGLFPALMLNASLRATAAVAPFGASLSSFHQNSPLL